MLRLLRKWFTPTYKEIPEFEWSPSGFNKAKRWAKAQPHPEVPRLSLWDYVDSGWIDSEYKLHQINKIKKEQNV